MNKHIVIKIRHPFLFLYALVHTLFDILLFIQFINMDSCIFNSSLFSGNITVKFIVFVVLDVLVLTYIKWYNLNIEKGSIK